MYFITVDAENTVIGVHDGSMDYVHRITGEPIEGARPIPDGAIKVGKACLDKIKEAGLTGMAVWDSVAGCVTLNLPMTLTQKQHKLFYARRPLALQEEVVRISTLSEVELDTELGSI